jgi:hypothetical protein
VTVLGKGDAVNGVNDWNARTMGGKTPDDSRLGAVRVNEVELSTAEIPTDG